MARGGPQGPRRSLARDVSRRRSRRSSVDTPRTRSGSASTACATRSACATTTRSGASSWRSSTTTRSSGDTPPSSRSTPNAASRTHAPHSRRQPSARPRTCSGRSRRRSRRRASRSRGELAERPVGLHRVTMLLAAVVAFGALCVSAGYSLAGPVKPFWVTSAETLTPLRARSGGRAGGTGRVDGVRALAACRGIRRESGVVDRFGDDGAAREDHRLGDCRRLRIRERSLRGDAREADLNS